MYEHVLSGCAPKPLSSYLKALGVLRILGEQADPKIVGWWSAEGFRCRTKLDAKELECFFTEKYAPTPIVAPWNGASGFYPNDNQDGIRAIEESSCDRLATYKNIIAIIKSWDIIPLCDSILGNILMKYSFLSSINNKEYIKIQNIILNINDCIKILNFSNHDIETLDIKTIKNNSKSPGILKYNAWSKLWKHVKKLRNTVIHDQLKERRPQILKMCRSTLPDCCLKWLDSAYTIGSDADAKCNWLLGSRGNDGHLDYTNNFMRHVSRIIIQCDTDKARKWWRAAVFGLLTNNLINGPIGQYDPGRAGGYNQGIGIERKDFKINPWDYVLMLEGTLMFAGSLVRKSATDHRGLLSSPFSVNFSPVGFASNDQAETSSRGEVWVPLWNAPTGLSELKHFFAEGRASLGRMPAKSGMEFARAIGQLGVDRGVNAFERFAFLKRRGDSHIALPAGRIGVGFRPELELLGDIDGHLDRVDTFLRQFKTVPVSFSRQRRILEENLFACATKPDTRSFGMVLRAFGRLDALISQRDRSKNPAFAKPIFGLSTKWLEACDDGGLEVRVAAALASIGKTGGVGPFRSSLSPVDPDRPWLWAKGRGQAEWVGSSLCERLGGILLRRIMDAERTGAKHAPFSGAIRLTTEDAAACALGLYDPMVFEDFLWGFSLIDFSKPVPVSVMSRWSKPVEEMVLPREWYLLKLLHSPTPIRDVVIRLEPRVSRLLAAGRVQEACEIAEYRLRVSGLSPFSAVYDSVLNPCDLLGSLMIPIARQHDLEKVVLVPTQPKE